jgi:thiamine-phosphate pyrophosphorylase
MGNDISLPGKFHLHAVTGPSYLNRPDFLSKAREILSSGLAAINLRAHYFEGRKFYDLALKLKEVAAKENTPLIINDRLDVALAVNAHAVHLGSRSIPLEVAAPLCRSKGILFGFSCHSLEEAEEAEREGASYLYLGTIFPSPSKPDSTAKGVDFLKLVCHRVKIPVLAIGGVNSSNVREIVSAGAYGAAAISAVWEAQDIAKTLEKMNRPFKAL